MVFKDKEQTATQVEMLPSTSHQKNMAINQAWDKLYRRLEKDGLLQDDTFRKSQRRHISGAGKLAVAAAIAACIITGWYFMHTTAWQDDRMQALYNEPEAPTLAKMLADGSVVYLSEQTTLIYPAHFADDKREVILQGEAFFDIAKKTECPFIIDTDIAKVEVTGTSFKIKSEPNALFLLSVREGEVRVMHKSSHQALTAKAGEAVFFDSERIQLQKNTVGFDDFFTCISFKDERLADVATIINLHLDTLQIKVDPTIGDRIITLPFLLSNNIVETAEAICKAMDLRLLQQDNELHITKPE